MYSKVILRKLKAHEDLTASYLHIREAKRLLGVSSPRR